MCQSGLIPNQKIKMDCEMKYYVILVINEILRTATTYTLTGEYKIYQIITL